MKNDMPMNCVNPSVSPTVAMADQMKMGIRKNFMPGARIRQMVVMMLTAVSTEPRPAMNTPMSTSVMPGFS